MTKSINRHDLVKEAYRFLIKKKYAHAIVMLDKFDISERESPYPHFLLAVACLYDNRFSRAADIISKLKLYHPDFIPVIHLEAFLFLKSASDLNHVMGRYVELNAEYPSDPHIHRGMKLIKNCRDFNMLQKNAKLHDFVEIPRPKLYLKELKKLKYNRSKSKEENIFRFKLSLFIYSIIVLLLVGYFFYNGVIIRMFSEEKQDVKYEREIDMVSLGGSSYNLINRINKEKTAEFYSSAEKMKEDFENSKKLIKTGKYNKSLLILNRIYASNASYAVKEKTNFLIKFVTGIEDREYENIPYKVLKNSSYLYRGAAVSWKGRIANFQKRERGAIFTLLVGYRKNDQFTGTAEIYSELADNNFKNGEMVEVKGIFISSIGNSGRIHLSARSISRI